VTVAWALPLLIVMQTRSAGVSSRPIAWAAQSPRPAECRGAPRFWELPLRTALPERCQELARAQALLVGAPARARELAAALLARAPDFTQARVVRGRASLRVGDAAGALADLSPLLEPGAGPSDPAALWDGGRAALAQNELATAARFYRALGSRAALLPSRAQQATAYLEIAAVLLVTGSAPIDDVLAFVREARRRSAGTGLSAPCAALTALSWRVEGREVEAQGALAEPGVSDELERLRERRGPWLPDGLLDALLAVSLEGEEPEAAARHYAALAAGPLARTRVGKLTPRPRPGKRGGR
jgi:hypothetical protein